MKYIKIILGKQFKIFCYSAVIVSIFIFILLSFFDIYLRIKKQHPKYVFDALPGPMVWQTHSLWYNKPNYSYQHISPEFLYPVSHDSLGHRIEFKSLKKDKVSHNKKTRIICIGV